MGDIVIPRFDVNSFNALRFLLVTVVVVPFLERSVSRLMRLFATIKILKGGTVHWRNVKAGYWMMHLGYYDRKSMVVLLLAAVATTGIYMAMEFGVSTCAIPQYSDVIAVKEELLRADRMIRHRDKPSYYDIRATLLTVKSESSVGKAELEVVREDVLERGRDYVVKVFPSGPKRSPSGVPVYNADAIIWGLITNKRQRFAFKRLQYGFELNKFRKGLRKSGGAFLSGPAKKNNGTVIVHGARENPGDDFTDPIIDFNSTASRRQMNVVTGADAVVTQAIVPLRTQRIYSGKYKVALEVLGGACTFSVSEGGLCVVPRRQSSLLQKRDGIKWNNLTEGFIGKKQIPTKLIKQNGVIVLRTATGFYDDSEQYHKAKCERSPNTSSLDDTFDVMVAYDLLPSARDGKGCKAGVMKSIVLTGVIATIRYPEGLEVTTGEMEAMLEERRWNKVVEKQGKFSAVEVADLLVLLTGVSTRKGFVREQYNRRKEYKAEMLRPCVTHFYVVCIGLIVLFAMGIEVFIFMLQVLSKRIQLQHACRGLTLLTRASEIMIGDSYNYAVAKISDDMKQSGNSTKPENKGLALHLQRTSESLFHIGISEPTSRTPWDFASRIV